MSTAPLIPTDEQAQRAAEARTVPDHPTVMGDRVGRLQRRPPEASLQDSYTRQEYRFRFGKRDLLLSPNPTRPEQGLRTAEWRIREPVHFLTGWNPLGRAGTFPGFESHQRILRADLRRPALAVLPAAALAANGGWLEGQLLVRGLTDDAASGFATENGQAAAIRWDGSSVEILPTGLEPLVTRVTHPVALFRLPSRTCPVRSDVDPAGRCTRYGGGWTSASIHASALWQEHRGVGIRLMGCDSCDDGREPAWGVGGSSISLGEILLASRYGNATWLP